MVELSVPLEMHMIPLAGHEYLADQYMTMAMDFFQKHTGVLAHPPVIKPQPGILWGGIAMITPATANKTASLDLRTAPLGAAMEPVTVDVARDATVIIDGQDAKFDDLTRGMRIKATQSATGAVSKIEVTTGNPRKSPPPAK